MANGWTSTQWPTYYYTSVSAHCITSSLVTCNYAIDYPSRNTVSVTNLPYVKSCFTGTNLTASILTTQTQTACASTSYFCQVTI